MKRQEFSHLPLLVWLRQISALLGEEFEVDGFAHGFVAGVAGVKVVAGVVGGEEHGWVGGILSDFVEVDDAVELGGDANPLVDGLAHGFAFGGLVFGSDEGGEGCADDLDAVGVGAFGQLAEAGDDIGGGDDIVRSFGVGGVADVVDALHDDEVFDAGLSDDVAVEAGKCAGAGGVVEDAVATDALVQDAEVRGLFVGLEAAGEDVGPAGVGVGGAVGAVGDAVAEGDDGGAVTVDFDVDAFEEGPGGDLFGRVEGLGADDVAGCGVAGLVGEVVHRDLGEGLGRDEEAYGEVGEGWELEVGGVADHHGSWRYGDGGTAAEGQGVGGAEVDFAMSGGEGDVRFADGERGDAELVAEDDANDRAAEGDVDDLAVGGVGGTELAGHILCGNGGSCPGADPVVGWGCG
jgi:hypothetical protein